MFNNNEDNIIIIIVPAPNNRSKPAVSNPLFSTPELNFTFTFAIHHLFVLDKSPQSGCWGLGRWRRRGEWGCERGGEGKGKGIVGGGMGGALDSCPFEGVAHGWNFTAGTFLIGSYLSTVTSAFELIYFYCRWTTLDSKAIVISVRQRTSI